MGIRWGLDGDQMGTRWETRWGEEKEKEREIKIKVKVNWIKGLKV